MMTAQKNKRAIVTVINSITETSMPYNEFAVFRHKMIDEELNIVLVCGKHDHALTVGEASSIQIVSCDWSILKIRKAVKEIIAKCNESHHEIIFHIHHPRAGVFFHTATAFMGLRKRTLFTVHNVFSSYRAAVKILSVTNVAFANYITNVSFASYNEYPALIKSIKGTRMVPVQNGVDLKRINKVMSRLDIEAKVSEEKVLIYVARMVPVKNHLFLLDVLKGLNAYHLFLVGAEDKRGEIRSYIEANNLEDSVTLTGLVTREEVFSMLRNADIYVSPSTKEGLPVSVLEAMATGLPVFLSNIQPHEELHIQSEHVMTLPLDKETWKRELSHYIEVPRDELKEIGLQCKRCAEDFFSLESMHERYTEIYQAILYDMKG